MSDFPRRTFITGAAAAGIVAAVAVSANTHDPIFAAIQAHKDGHTRHEQCLREAEVYENAVNVETSRLAHEEFAAIKASGIKIDDEDDLFRSIRFRIAVDKTRDSHAMREMYRLRSEGSDAEMNAYADLLNTVPTTLPGVVAFVEHILHEEEEGNGPFDFVTNDEEEEGAVIILRSIHECLRGLR